MVALAAASGGSTSLAPSVIAATAALLGVGIGQLISTLQRRHDERERWREKAASALAKTLALSMDAIEQIQRGSGVGLEWRAQPEWRRLLSEEWPIARDLLLQEVAYDQPDTTPSFLAVAESMQHLLMDEDADKAAALRSWNALRDDTIKLRRRLF